MRTSTAKQREGSFRTLGLLLSTCVALQVQDIWVHFVVLLVCLVSIVVAVIELVETFDPHTWQSISILVSFLPAPPTEQASFITLPATAPAKCSRK